MSVQQLFAISHYAQIYTLGECTRTSLVLKLEEEKGEEETPTAFTVIVLPVGGGGGGVLWSLHRRRPSALGAVVHEDTSLSYPDPVSTISRA